MTDGIFFSHFFICSMSNHTLEIIVDQMTFYGPIILLIIGTLGCLCNFLTFTSPQLRRNSCAFYFLCSSIFELFSICFGLITRFIADHSISDLQNHNRIYCKCRAYFVSSIPLIATYFVLLTSIDRYLSTSIHSRLRSFSQMKIVYRASLIAVFTGLISCVHILYSYDLRPKCATIPNGYAIFDGMFAVFWLGVIPHIVMLIFGYLTLINIKQLRTRMYEKQVRFNEKTDRQLMIVSEIFSLFRSIFVFFLEMMFVQIGFSSLLILTRMIYYAYYILSPNLTGTKKSIGAFLMSLTTLLYYSNYSKSFYIYTLSSPLFRRIFLDRLKEYSLKVCHPIKKIFK